MLFVSSFTRPQHVGALDEVFTALESARHFAPTHLARHGASRPAQTWSRSRAERFLAQRSELSFFGAPGRHCGDLTTRAIDPLGGSYFASLCVTVGVHWSREAAADVIASVDDLVADVGRLFVALRGEYGIVALPESRSSGIGLYAEGLPDLHWINFVGPELLRNTGRGWLDAAPFEQKIELGGDRHALILARAPGRPITKHHGAVIAQAKRAIGSEWFVEPGADHATRSMSFSLEGLRESRDSAARRNEPATNVRDIEGERPSAREVEQRVQSALAEIRPSAILRPWPGAESAGWGSFELQRYGDDARAMWIALDARREHTQAAPCVLLQPVSTEDSRRFVPSFEPVRLAAALDAAARFDADAWVQDAIELDADRFESFSGPWPERAAPQTQRLAPRDDESLVFALFGTPRSWEIPLVLAFGDWNECPAPHVHAAMLKRWGDRYGARLLALAADRVAVEVARRPADREEALALAREHYVYCPDQVEQAFETLEALAASLLVSDGWDFWWD